MPGGKGKKKSGKGKKQKHDGHQGARGANRGPGDQAVQVGPRAPAQAPPPAAPAAERERPRQVEAADRHGAEHPFLNFGPWLAMMKRDRIAHLFLTQAGLAGHVVAVQQEITRLVGSLADGLVPLRYRRLVEVAVEELKEALRSASEAARFPHQFTIDFGEFGQVVYKKT